MGIFAVKLAEIILGDYGKFDKLSLLLYTEIKMSDFTDLNLSLKNLKQHKKKVIFLSLKKARVGVTEPGCSNSFSCYINLIITHVKLAC